MKPTIHELENLMSEGKNVRLKSNGQVSIDEKPEVHLLEDVLLITKLKARVAELEVVVDRLANPDWILGLDIPAPVTAMDELIARIEYAAKHATEQSG